MQRSHSTRPAPLALAALLALPALVLARGDSSDPATQDTQGPRVLPDAPKGAPPFHPVEGADASSPQEMQDFTESIPGSKATFGMKALPGGTFLMGSPEEEDDRSQDEGPQVEVKLSPFWIGTHEVTWAEYKEFTDSLDLQRRAAGAAEGTPQDPWSDAVSRPTPPYVPMDFNMGIEGYPAICMTQFAARQYTKWLSMKTGRWYRLPTEAEWEYACRAGTGAPNYALAGDSLGDIAWYGPNAGGETHPVATKTANALGFHDMLGNAWEWVADLYDGFYYLSSPAVDPTGPATGFLRVIRGGSWYAPESNVRSPFRGAFWPEGVLSDTGFRVARNP